MIQNTSTSKILKQPEILSAQNTIQTQFKRSSICILKKANAFVITIRNSYDFLGGWSLIPSWIQPLSSTDAAVLYHKTEIKHSSLAPNKHRWDLSTGFMSLRSLTAGQPSSSCLAEQRSVCLVWFIVNNHT